MDCERLSSRGLCMDVEAVGFMALAALGTAIKSWLAEAVAVAASTAPLLLLPRPRLPAFELELSRRNRPMTDLGCLGLFIPPTWARVRSEHSWLRATSKCTRYREIERDRECGRVCVYRCVGVGNSYQRINNAAKRRKHKVQEIK